MSEVQHSNDMKIIVDKLIPTYLKDRNYEPLVVGRDNFIYKQDVKLSEYGTEEIYVINWGENLHAYPHGVIETGFFWDGVHLDKHGLYTFCSFNFSDARKIVENFSPKKSAKEMFQHGMLKSKLGQPREKIEWDGIVLACQRPVDRSIHKGGRTVDYLRFIEKACEYYGKRLFIKIHPVNTKEEEEWVKSVANKHGCMVGRVDVSVVDKAEFVLVYNSTFVVDCLLRETPVAHYALGYFWNSGAVKYTAQTIPKICKTDIEYGQKLCDFLVWKYCFHRKDSMDNWASIFKEFSTSSEFFPLPEELSYGAYVTNNNNK